MLKREEYFCRRACRLRRNPKEDTENHVRCMTWKTMSGKEGFAAGAGRLLWKQHSRENRICAEKPAQKRPAHCAGRLLSAVLADW